jgi:histidine triad (HIT) family protein
MSECLFCKIARHKIDSAVVYEDEEVMAFHDVSPQAPVHVLIIPKNHIESVNTIDETHQSLMGKMMIVARLISVDLGIDKSGYRLVINCNKDGGQTVYHLHMHLMGGRQLHWPPG